MIVFSRYSWVGTAEDNPGEEPRQFPPELKHVAAAAAAAAGPGAGAAGETAGAYTRSHCRST